MNRTFTAALIAGAAALALGAAPSASAAPLNGKVCAYLDQYGVGNIDTMAAAVLARADSAALAGEMGRLIGTDVRDNCPEYLPALLRWADSQ